MVKTLLSLLDEKGTYVSGQQISSRLGITRAGVWKKVLALRQKGYGIEAARSKGYRLVSTPDPAEEYVNAKVCGRFWKQVLFYDSLESTNDLAMSRAAEGTAGAGTVIIADRQEKGKGRLGRQWVSPAGSNIYMSLVIRPELEPRDATLITLLAAVAGADALRETTAIPVTIKWPNDLVVGSRKIGGILTEIRADPDRVAAAVVGMGINVNMASRDFPEAIRPIATSVLLETGAPHSRNDLIIRLLQEYERWSDILKQRGRGALLDGWRARTSTLGRKLAVSLQDRRLTGIAEDIDNNGMLIMKTDAGQRITVSSGDISFLP